MKQIPILIILLALSTTFSWAQSAKSETFVDAVPYSMHDPSNLFLTNQDAEAVKAYFTRPGYNQPDIVVPVDDGYYHGYRFCYNSTDCTNREMPARWIQVVTINTKESIEWFEKSNPEFLMVPFIGIEAIVGSSGHSRSDFREVYARYRHLACRLYQQAESPARENANVLSMVLHAYNNKIRLQTDQLLASGGEGVLLLPGLNKKDYWDLWMQCLEEIDEAGYITLIEYSEAP